MPHWVSSRDYSLPWEYLANVTVRNKNYTCWKEWIEQGHNGEIQEMITIRLLDLSEEGPLSLAESSTPIQSGMRVVYCQAASHEDQITLLVNLFSLESLFSYLLISYDTVSQSWSRHATTGPTPSLDQIGISCLIASTLFVYQRNMHQLPPVRSVYTLDMQTKEWSLLHVSPMQLDEYIIREMSSWKHYLVGLGRGTYREERGQVVIAEQHRWNVSLFDTRTNTWLLLQSSGDPPSGPIEFCMEVYRDKLLFICQQDHGTDQVNTAIYSFDLNNCSWSKMDYKGKPAPASAIDISCFRINHLIYCIFDRQQDPNGITIEVLSMKTMSLTNLCFKSICDASIDVSRLSSAFAVASKTANAIS